MPINLSGDVYAGRGSKSTAPLGTSVFRLCSGRHCGNYQNVLRGLRRLRSEHVIEYVVTI